MLFLIAAADSYHPDIREDFGRMIYIANFTISRELSDVEYYFNNGEKTNIDYILEDFVSGITNWSCPQKAQLGDVVVFMCAKTARNNIGMANSHIPANYSQRFLNFVVQQKNLYKKYSGYILGFGTVASTPSFDVDSNRWYADIDHLQQFPIPVYIDEFRSFISISTTSSITYLKSEQWERLRWLVNQKNPGFFQNVVSPSLETLDHEFERAVQKEASKSLEQLEKAAKKKSAAPSSSTVQTKSYHRDPTIAAYVKKRAHGCCQLCGLPAPFVDQSGEPYLECHHIDWLSNGGMDSIDNCVALCPNCHRKMHMLNDPNDISILKSKVL